MSAHARYAAYAAAQAGYAFRSLDGDDGYLFEVRDGQRHALFAAGAGSPYALNDANAASLARDKSFCAEALREAHLPVIPGRVFFITDRWRDMRGPGREPADARAFARNAEYPLFCKPISASNGLYAEIITDFPAFEDYIARASREHFAILIQPVIRGDEHRVFVLEGRPLFCYRKLLPSIIGDGASSARVLIDNLPRDTRPPIERTRIRDAAGNVIDPSAVLEANARAFLEGPANRAAGGAAADLSGDVPQQLAQIAVNAAHTLNLKLAAIDLFDVSPARDLSDLVIIEVNSKPMIKTLEDHNRWDLIDTIWRANFAAALR